MTAQPSVRNLSIDGDRLWDSLMEMAKIGKTAKDGVCRLALTDLDRESRDLFIKILDDEEEHIDKLEAELGLIDKVGIQNYLQKHMFTTDKE